MGSLNYPFFLVLLQILIFNRSYSSFRADFISIEEISVLYNIDSDFITVQTKIKAKIWIFSLTPCLLISFFIFLLSLIGDDWNPIMEH